jgi:K+-sensing histidine kinase KdpD
LGNAGFHGLQIAVNFRLRPSPFSGGGIAYRFHIIAAHRGSLRASPGDRFGAIFRIVLPTDSSEGGTVEQIVP